MRGSVADHDRDRAIERLLPQVLGGAASTPCVDGETLAAWSEGALRASDMASVEAHVADCARCQAMVGAFVRITPAPAVTEPASRRWSLGWLLPLATAAAALALWAIIPTTSVRPESQVALSEPSRDTVAAAPPPVQGQVMNPAPPEPTGPAAAAAKTERGQVMNDERRAADTLAKQERDARADAADAEKPSDAPRALAETVTVTGGSPPVDTAQTLASQRARNEAPAQTAPPIEQRKAVEERTASARPAPPPLPVAEAVPVPAAPLPPAAATAGGAATAERAAPSLFRAMVAIIPIPSPVPTTRWHIVDGQRVERAPAGRFEPVVLPEPATLSAGAAPSATVCWVVGRAGRVFLTIDGERFTRVAFPEAVDLAGVTATDARTAAVRTADGRTFRTSDGGVTWTQ